MASVKLMQHDDDPMCLRASCGGTEDIGYYCVFRGERSEIVKCLERIITALKSDQPLVKDTNAN
jgi:hypothetical protein